MADRKVVELRPVVTNLETDEEWKHYRERFDAFREGVRLEQESNPGNKTVFASALGLQPNKELSLSVRVTNIEAAEIVLRGIHNSFSFIPGIEIESIVLNPDQTNKSILANKLRDIADQLDNNEL